jgi:phosphoglycerate dehydrogenase-like enzyme
MKNELTIWTNVGWALERKGAAGEMFARAVGGHRVVSGDAGLAEAEVAFGGPPVALMLKAEKLRWVQVTSAGYTPYDRPEVWEWLKARGVAFTNGSSVFDEACAEHLLAMMLGLCRQLPRCVERQVAGGSEWSKGFRGGMRVLQGERAILYGYGAIGRRLAELLAPFRMEVVGVRRRIRGDENVRVVTASQADEMLAEFDHVVNILPANAGTEHFFDAARFGRMRKGAMFYNIGRGATVVQADLIAALESGQVGGAYLDVTTPEPLPVGDPLWKAPNCWITPHTGGGYVDGQERVARHFLENLGRFVRGEALTDRVV